MGLDLSKGNLGKIILRYGLPSIATMWIFALYTIVDGFFIGKFLGANELAAVNIVMPYVNLSFALGIMIAIGGATIISISLGEKNFEKAHRVYSLSLELFMILGGFLGTIGIFFPHKIVEILGANEIILADATTYLFYLSFFTVFYLLSYGLEIFVRVDGNTLYSLVCIIIGALLNIILDYLFIIKFNMGIIGAGLATGIAQFGTAASLGYYLLLKSTKLRFSFVKIDIPQTLKILYNGSSEFLTEIATGIVIMAFNINIINIVGEKGVSAFGIISYISTLVTMTMIGFSQGLQPVISYNFGAKNFKRIKKVMKISSITVTILGILFFLVCNIFVKEIISIFIKDDKILFEVTKNAINLYSFTYVLMGINIIISAYFTAIEDAFISAVLSVLRGMIFVNILLFTLPKFLGINGIWLTSPINEFLSMIVSIGVFLTLGVKKIRQTP
ncbi:MULTISPECIES: MATE family efflux transporter [Fusobacterium]|uniref:MATE family efflux transporter n=1 Tax=Fusobacterium TaxID=848 RepID=UPI001F482D60|nr:MULTISPECIES: MATE family efflux transporter [Fusobacterium]MCF2612986.1 MATE family efflux transporter [Fusobacterium perfoetens]MDY2981512.1 MATE family efflux transporter [Fusobacterium sp.]